MNIDHPATSPRIMAELNLSQTKLAEMLGVWESEEVWPNFDAGTSKQIRCNSCK